MKIEVISGHTSGQHSLSVTGEGQCRRLFNGLIMDDAEEL